MNKLEIFNNKAIPMDWDDIDWLQESVRDAFYGLLSAFGITEEDSFIISGCVVTVGDHTADITAGWISFEGEICKVETDTIVWTGDKIVKFQISETDDPTGTELDSDDNTVECYKVRKAVIVDDVAAAGQMLHDADTLQDKLKALVFDAETSWTTATLLTGFTHVSGDEVKYRVNKIGNVELIGSFTSSVTSGLLMTLPEGKRPTKEHYIRVIWQTYETKVAIVGTDGDIVIPANNASDSVPQRINDTLYL